MKRIIVAVALLATFAVDLRAQDINTNSAAKNIQTMMNGQTTIPVTTNAVVNKFKIAFDALGSYIDIGGTETIGFEHGSLTFKPSLTIMGKVPFVPTSGTISNIFGSGVSADWEAGPVMSYVPALSEYDAGVGVSIDVFRLPPAIAQVQSQIAVIDTLTPKATVVKFFLGVEVKLNNLGQEQIPRVVTGFTLPMGS